MIVLFNGNVLKAHFREVVQGTTFPKSSPTPNNAPIFHIDGPLKVIKDEFRDRSKSERADFLIYLSLGTEYEGVERTDIRYECVVESSVPTMSLSYTGHPTVHYPLTRRC